MGFAADTTLALGRGMRRATPIVMANPKEELPTRKGTTEDPSSPREIENPGDPGPTVLVPPETDDPRCDPKLPPDVKKPSPGA